MPQVDLVCLANVRTYGERCVAGFAPHDHRCFTSSPGEPFQGDCSTVMAAVIGLPG